MFSHTGRGGQGLCSAMQVGGDRDCTEGSVVAAAVVHPQDSVRGTSLLSIHRTLSGGRHCCPSTGLCQGDVTVVHPQDSVRGTSLLSIHRTLSGGRHCCPSTGLCQGDVTVVSTAVLCTSHGEQPSQWSVVRGGCVAVSVATLQ